MFNPREKPGAVRNAAHNLALNSGGTRIVY
jgi:hypothetical protein